MNKSRENETRRSSKDLSGAWTVVSQKPGLSLVVVSAWALLEEATFELGLEGLLSSWPGS